MSGAATAVAEQLAAAVTQFLEAAAHTVLKARGVYSPALFESRRLYGIPVAQCRHPGVCAYIGTVLGSIKVCCVLWRAWRDVFAAATCACARVCLRTLASQRCCRAAHYMSRAQPLLLQDTLQEVVVVFYGPDGALHSKCAFVVQVRVCVPFCGCACGVHVGCSAASRAWQPPLTRTLCVLPQGFAASAQCPDWSALEPAFRSVLLKLHFSDNVLRPLPAGEAGTASTFRSCLPFGALLTPALARAATGASAVAPCLLPRRQCV
jgi:hypothetical protein